MAEGGGGLADGGRTGRWHCVTLRRWRNETRRARAVAKGGTRSQNVLRQCGGHTPRPCAPRDASRRTTATSALVAVAGNLQVATNTLAVAAKMTILACQELPTVQLQRERRRAFLYSVLFH